MKRMKEKDMTQKELRIQLEELAEQDYKEFSAALLPGVKNMLGIRLPKLREMAKVLAVGNWKEYLSWSDFIYFEEIMIQGMLLGYAEAPIEEILVAAKQFIPRIDNWSVNDSFCATFKIAKKYPKEVWDFLMQYKESRKEFEVRMMATMLMSHFLIPEYISQVLNVLGSLNGQAYYASMAVAWAYATAWAKFPEMTKTYLTGQPVDEMTYLRTLQKGIESRRISEEDKEWMRAERARLRGRLDKSAIQC